MAEALGAFVWIGQVRIEFRDIFWPQASTSNNSSSRKQSYIGKNRLHVTAFSYRPYASRPSLGVSRDSGGLSLLNARSRQKPRSFLREDNNSRMNKARNQMPEDAPKPRHTSVTAVTTVVLGHGRSCIGRRQQLQIETQKNWTASSAIERHGAGCTEQIHSSRAEYQAYIVPRLLL